MTTAMPLSLSAVKVKLEPAQAEPAVKDEAKAEVKDEAKAEVKDEQGTMSAQHVCSSYACLLSLLQVLCQVCVSSIACKFEQSIATARANKCKQSFETLHRLCNVCWLFKSETIRHGVALPAFGHSWLYTVI